MPGGDGGAGGGDARAPHPGTALGHLPGGPEKQAFFGLASLSSLSYVTPETLVQIGSLCETFTATAVRRLTDEETL